MIHTMLAFLATRGNTPTYPHKIILGEVWVRKRGHGCERVARPMWHKESNIRATFVLLFMCQCF